MKLLPFTYPWIIRKNLGNAKTILDVGCGDGAQMEMINYDNRFKVTGIDLYKPSLKKAKETGVYSDVKYGDVRKLSIKPKSYDVVFSSQVVEHLEKKEALVLIKTMEKIARQKVIIGTTHGFFPFDPLEGKDGNPLQVHQSGWEIKEFVNKKYQVFGQGLGIVYKPNALAHSLKPLNSIWFGLSYFLSPITYYIPKVSTYIVAVKKLQ